MLRTGGCGVDPPPSKSKYLHFVKLHFLVWSVIETLEFFHSIRQHFGMGNTRPGCHVDIQNLGLHNRFHTIYIYEQIPMIITIFGPVKLLFRVETDLTRRDCLKATTTSNAAEKKIKICNENLQYIWRFTVKRSLTIKEECWRSHSFTCQSLFHSRPWLLPCSLSGLLKLCLSQSPIPMISVNTISPT